MSAVLDCPAIHTAVALDTAVDVDSAALKGVCTVVTARSPAIVSKIWRVVDGVARKVVAAELTDGVLSTPEFGSLDEFGRLLVALGPSNCLIYGIPAQGAQHIITDKAWKKAGKPLERISRTKDNFAWDEKRPGILMLDHDPQPGMRKYTPDEVVDALRSSVPCLTGVDLLSIPSASSLIWNTSTEAWESVLKGFRIYVFVDHAPSIPALGQYIVDAMWATGHGVYAVSVAGSRLERGLFDTSVWQTNRIDFAAGAVCEPPLQQRRGEPVLHAGARRMVALRSRFASGGSGASIMAAAHVPDLPDEQAKQARARKQAAKAAVAEEAAQVREGYSKTKVIEFTQVGIAAGQTPAVAKARAETAVAAMLREEGPELLSDAVVTLVTDEGRRQVRVEDILLNRWEYHGLKTLDPVEPGYNNHAVVGKLYLNGAVPVLNSFAHGGRRFKLLRQHGEVQVVKGSLPRIVDHALELLRKSGDVFDFGDALVTVSSDGRMTPITPGLVPYTIAHRVRFYSESLDPQKQEVKRRDEDPPGPVCTTVFEKRASRGLPRLNAIVTAPLMVGERLIDKPGYDEVTGLLLAPQEDMPRWPRNPTLEQVRDAFERVWALFATFPFETLEDRAVFFCALLTAALRPGLRTAPGFALDAPAQGTGKTLLAECVSLICSGRTPSALPHLHNDEPEVRKRIGAVLLAGDPVLIWDNVVGIFDSPVLASMLTSERFADRILGETRRIELPNRMLCLFTGNNLSLRGELTRRVLVCRLDAKEAAPYRREFSVNPRAVCAKDRLAIVADLLTILRGYQTLGAEFAGSATLGSYEEWSTAVLRPVLWLASILPADRLGDPLAKITENEDADDDLIALGRLAAAWQALYGAAPMTTREVVDRLLSAGAGVGRDRRLVELESAVSDFADLGSGKNSPSSAARELGKVLGFRKERRVNKLRFSAMKTRAGGGAIKWRVLADDAGGNA